MKIFLVYQKALFEHLLTGEFNTTSKGDFVPKNRFERLKDFWYTKISLSRKHIYLGCIIVYLF